MKELEENGIGRPSTYATILATIVNRDYVEKEKSRFRPTELGMLVNDLLVESFGDIVQVGYTARLEEELDEIEEGRLDWIDALREFQGIGLDECIEVRYPIGRSGVRGEKL